MPSLYFNYAIDGLVVEIAPMTDGLSAFLIKLCAIVGGTYAVASFIDHAIDSIIDDRRKQYELINWSYSILYKINISIKSLHLQN